MSRTGAKSARLGDKQGEKERDKTTKMEHLLREPSPPERRRVPAGSVSRRHPRQATLGCNASSGVENKRSARPMEHAQLAASRPRPLARGARFAGGARTGTEYYPLLLILVTANGGRNTGCWFLVPSTFEGAVETEDQNKN